MSWITEMTIDNVKENQGKKGSLKPVSRCRNPFTCVYCNHNFPAGVPCYTQNDYSRDGFFPVQTRVCIDCGKEQIANGVPVKEKKVAKKKVEKKLRGCGKETEYPKPEGGMWKCGEEAPIIGVIKCKSCGGLK